MTKHATVIVPIVCTRCGEWKRDATGRTLYVSLEWRRAKRMVCPTCFEGEKLMGAMDKLVWDDEDEVPF